MLRVSVLMFLAPTLANVYQATRATEKANVKVHISQNLVSIKNCYIHNANVFKGLAISKGACAFLNRTSILLLGVWLIAI